MSGARTPSAGEPASWAGQLLLAQPGMQDPNFRRTVVMLSAHSPEGALGFVMNRPLERTLAEAQPEFAGGPLAGVPVYFGGPVESERLMLAAWHLAADESSFKVYFGLAPGRLLELLGDYPEVTVRAFAGYAGWSSNQLEAELKRADWLVVPVQAGLLGDLDGVPLWRELVGTVSPRHRLMTDLPDDPSVN